MPTYNKTYKNGKVYGKVMYNGKSYGKVIFEEGGTPPQPADPSLLLDIPFDGDFENKVIGGIQMVVAGGAPTFANGAAVFNGSQSIKTAMPLDIGTDKVTVCMWIKTTQTSVGILAELTGDSDSLNGFYISLNNTDVNKLVLRTRNQNYYEIIDTPIISGFNYYTFVIDRSNLPFQKCHIYTNGILTHTVQTVSGNNTGLFDSDIFYIGQRILASYHFIGELKKFQLYNRVLSDSEILAKYNEVPQPPAPTIVKSYTWQDTEQKLFGISAIDGLVDGNNAITPFIDPPRIYRVWQGIPVVGYSKLNMDIQRYGGYWATMFGFKNGVRTLILNYSGNTSAVLEHFEIDVFQYDHITIGTHGLPDDLLTIKFIQ